MQIRSWPKYYNNNTYQSLM